MGCPYVQYEEKSNTYKSLFGKTKTHTYTECYCRSINRGPIEDKFGLQGHRADICRDTGYSIYCSSGGGGGRSKYILHLCVHLPKPDKERLKNNYLNTGYTGYNGTGKIIDVKEL